MINNLNSLNKKIETLLFKYNEQKKINQDLETKIEYLIKSNQDLGKKIKEDRKNRSTRFCRSKL